MYFFRRLIRRLPGKVVQAIPVPHPKVTEGCGSRGSVGEICAHQSYVSVLIVTDTTLSLLGYEQAVVQSLQQYNIRCEVYSCISGEPVIPVVEQVRAAAWSMQADCIIGIGGGSVLDVVKMASAAVKYRHIGVKHLLLKFLPVPGRALPVIAIPATAGTGAEVSVGAIVLNASGVKKSTVIVGLNIPHVILDSELTLHAPHDITAACGIDALSHAIEAACSSVKVKPEHARYAHEGVKLIMEHLPVLLSQPQQVEARQGMCRAAMYGGYCISYQLAGYVHAFAHAIGAKYHMAHGKAIALVLVPVLQFQREACLHKYAYTARYSGIAHNGDSEAVAADKLLCAIAELTENCKLHIVSPVKPEDYTELTRMIIKDSINYSPMITMSSRHIKQVLTSITSK